MKRIGITGATGFVGANLARACLERGHEVHLLVRPGFRNWRLNGLEGDLHLHELDLRDRTRVASVLGVAKPDWLFHLAAYGAYEAQDDWLEALRTNVEATMVLLGTAAERGFELFAYAGSSSEYGHKATAPSEDDALEPNSSYAVTKASASLFVRHYAQKLGLNAAVLRLYSVYGPFEEPGRLMPAVVLAGLEKRYPPFVDPETARDFVYVDDVVDAFFALARARLAQPGRIFNIGSGTQTTIRDVAATAARVFGIQAPPEWNAMPARRWDTHAWVSNPARAQAELGWSARFDLEAGLRAFANWMRDAAHARHYRTALPAS